METIELEITNVDGTKTIVGPWTLPDEKIANFREQADVGWHVMFALTSGAQEVRVKRSVSQTHSTGGRDGQDTDL